MKRAMQKGMASAQTEVESVRLFELGKDGPNEPSFFILVVEL